MPLSEEAFSALVEAGCSTCSIKKLAIESIVPQKLPLLDGELHGAPSWAYKGEDLVRGVWQVRCVECAATLFSSSACSRCGAEGGVERALSTVNTLALPTACEECGNELVTAHAYVSATVIYEGKRARPPRTHTERDDPGFHAFRIECKRCRHVVERRHLCPLCASA